MVGKLMKQKNGLILNPHQDSVASVRNYGLRLVSSLVVAGLCAGLISAVSFGVIGIGRGNGTRNSDGAVFYAAGKSWLEGRNPYDATSLVSVPTDGVNLSRAVFAYPPQAAGLCIPMAASRYSQSQWGWCLVNFLSLLLGGIFVLRLMKDRRPAVLALAMMLMLGNPFATHVLWMGQTSLFVNCCILAAWYLSLWHSPILSGFLLGVASMKPQLSLLPSAWMILVGRWKIAVSAGASVLLMASYPLATRGVSGSLKDWTAALSSYSESAYNTGAALHKVGLPVLCESLGLHLPVILPGILSLGALGTIWAFRTSLRPLETISLLLSTDFILTGLNHDYDYVCVMPLLAAMIDRCGRKKLRWIPLLMLTLLFFIPQRWVKEGGWLPLDQWRTVVLAASTLMLALWIRKDPKTFNPVIP